jgi:hypothetical protein
MEAVPRDILCGGILCGGILCRATVPGTKGEPRIEFYE